MTSNSEEQPEVQIPLSAIDPNFAGADVLGIVCPKCGCQDMRVRRTIELDGSVKRYRYCRACLRGLPTEEIPASELANLRRLAGNQ